MHLLLHLVKELGGPEGVRPAVFCLFSLINLHLVITVLNQLCYDVLACVPVAGGPLYDVRILEPAQIIKYVVILFQLLDD